MKRMKYLNSLSSKVLPCKSCNLPPKLFGRCLAELIWQHRASKVALLRLRSSVIQAVKLICFGLDCSQSYFESSLLTSTAQKFSMSVLELDGLSFRQCSFEQTLLSGLFGITLFRQTSTAQKFYTSVLQTINKTRQSLL